MNKAKSQKPKARNKEEYSGVKRFAQAQGIDLFGVADIGSIKNNFALSQKILDKLERAVCIGVRLSASILDEIEAAPTKLYFHHYRTVNALLDQAALKICNYIQGKGFQALPIPASVILDWENQLGHLSHRQVGVLAGLGWIGRNNLLVNKKYGAQFRLATVLTDMPLEPDQPQKNSCGNCNLCVRLCPASAIRSSSLDFERLKCLQKLKEFQKQKLVDQYICGICVKACPTNKK